VIFLKKFFRITAFRISLVIALLFVGIAAIYDIKPDMMALTLAMAEKSLDYKFQLRGTQKAKAKIVIVAGDEKSFQTFGQWPFDRATVFSPLVDKLCSYHPKALGFDIVWSEPEKLVPGGVKNALATSLNQKVGALDQIIAENSGDAVLRRSLENCKTKIVMGYALQHNADEGLPKDEYERRLKTLITDGHNVLTSQTKGRVKFGRAKGDPEANVDFHYVAQSGLLNHPNLTPPTIAQGFFNNEQDSDGNYRHASLFFRAGDSFVPSLTLRMAQKFLTPNDAPGMVVIAPYDSDREAELRLDLPTPTGKIKVPVDLGGQVIVNYRGPNSSYPNISMADVLSPSDTVEYELVEKNGEPKKYKVHKTELFKDSLVLVGMTAMALYDIRPRPFDGRASGVENHATILDNLVSDDFLVKPTKEVLIGLLFATLLISLIFGHIISKLDAKWGAVFAITTITGLLYLDQFYLFNKQGIVYSGHLQAVQFLLQYIGITLLKFMQEESEKRFIRSAFDKYVSPAVINSMLKDPGKLRLGGEKREISVMFSDIRGFTELSEKVDVKQLTSFLNDYLGAMTDILQSNQGTLDKYIGDAVMGFWGAPLEFPNHASLAVKTAVEMVARLDELNKEFTTKYGFTIDIGIGINSGAVSVGNFGSNKVFEYTVIGDNVNLASRLEGINKYYGTHVIISETTYSQLKPNEFLCREVDTVRVKGKHKPVKIYEVFPDNATHAPLKNSLKVFNEGLMHYYARQWEKAIAFFQTVLQSRDGDKPSLELIERCNHYLQNPPETNWDGSWEMTSK